MNKNVVITASLIVVVVAAAIIIPLTALNENPNESSHVNKTSAVSSQKLSITLPRFDEEVYLCSDAMKNYYKGDCTLEEAASSDKTLYKPFVFEYSVKNADSATLLLGEKEDYSDAVSYDLNLSSRSISIDNLKTGTIYHYSVTAQDSDGDTKTEKGFFKTADTNRFIHFSGVYNTRDIGGYYTIYGKKIKQGVLIRGTELDGLVESGYYLNDVADTEPFGFVCDFDLRNNDVFSANYVSMLGENVSHKFYNSPMYGNIFSKDNAPIIKEIFTELANKNNYPMYLHCTYGCDRTGTIIYLLQGLLGVSEEDMMTEFRLSGFFLKKYLTGDDIRSLNSGLQGIHGETINEKIKNYMTETVGLSEEQIQNLRDIFLEQ